MDDLEKIFENIVNENIPREEVEKIISEFKRYDKDKLLKILIDYEDYLIKNSAYHHGYVSKKIPIKGILPAEFIKTYSIANLPLYYGFFINAFDSFYTSKEYLSSKTVEPIYQDDEYTKTILFEYKSLIEIIKYFIGENNVWEMKFSNQRDHLKSDVDDKIIHHYDKSDELIYYSQLPLFKKSFRFIWYNYPPIINDKYYQITFSLKKHLNALRHLYFNFQSLPSNIEQDIDKNLKNIYMFKLYADIVSNKIPNIFNDVYKEILQRVSNMNRVEYNVYKEESLLNDVSDIKEKKRNLFNSYNRNFYDYYEDDFENFGFEYNYPDDNSTFSYPSEESIPMKRGFYLSSTYFDRYFLTNSFLFHKSLFQLIKYENITSKEKIKKYQKDNYWKLAHQYYHHGLKWPDVYKNISKEMTELGLNRRYKNFDSFKRGLSFYNKKKRRERNT